MVDIDTEKVHTSKLMKADLLVRSTDIEIIDRSKGSGLVRTQFVLDIKVVAKVNGKGNWQETCNSHKPQFENPGNAASSSSKIKASMRLIMLVLDTVSSRLLVLILVLLVRLLSGICGLLPGWNSTSVP